MLAATASSSRKMAAMAWAVSRPPGGQVDKEGAPVPRLLPPLDQAALLHPGEDGAHGGLLDLAVGGDGLLVAALVVNEEIQDLGLAGGKAQLPLGPAHHPAAEGRVGFHE